MVNESNSDSSESDTMYKDLKRAIGSGQVNYLFGVGVNGTCFKNMSGFLKTLDKVKELGGIGDNLEESISSLSEKNVKKH